MLLWWCCILELYHKPRTGKCLYSCCRHHGRIQHYYTQLMIFPTSTPPTTSPPTLSTPPSLTISILSRSRGRSPVRLLGVQVGDHLSNSCWYQQTEDRPPGTNIHLAILSSGVELTVSMFYSAQYLTLYHWTAVLPTVYFYLPSTISTDCPGPQNCTFCPIIDVCWGVWYQCCWCCLLCWGGGDSDGLSGGVWLSWQCGRTEHSTPLQSSPAQKLVLSLLLHRQAPASRQATAGCSVLECPDCSDIGQPWVTRAQGEPGPFWASTTSY